MTKQSLYETLARELQSLFRDEHEMVCNMANFSSVVFHSLPDVSWAGFYRLCGGQLLLGPFQGKPACIRIPVGRGVCGTAAAKRRSVLVADVREFEGHIACDPDSRSELVVPLIDSEGRLRGVFDLDSTTIGRFDATDQQGIESLVKVFLKQTILAT